MIISSSISECTYEALSYEWGHFKSSKEIFINGMRFFVRDNLWNALYDLREDSPRRLWIDALCIDQQNVDERNHQVQGKLTTTVKPQENRLFLSRFGLCPDI
ncbi:heterokaryon incompatibility protein-domain-containing protein, partial [Cadophora sp. MPI-SDFR-AT-0126]